MTASTTSGGATESDADDPRHQLQQVLATVPDTIDQVIEQLTEIEKITREWPPLGPDDGVACFTRLYLRITKDVKEEYEKGELFRGGDFIVQLDVAFARRYLDALRDWVGEDTTTPGCWAILFDRRGEDISPWRFAATGVNAHVNFDLTFALLDVWEANPVPLADTDSQYHDYNGINTIFYRRMEELCETFDAPWSLRGGTSWSERAGTVLGDVLVWGTRDLAWNWADRMWADRENPEYRTGPTETLDLVATKLAETLV